MELVVDLYKMTEQIPDSEQFGLISQIKRSVTSIPAHIAEGVTRKNTQELVHFLYVSLGSMSELETHIELAKRLNFVNDIDIFSDKLIYIRKKTIKLIRTLESMI